MCVGAGAGSVGSPLPSPISAATASLTVMNPSCAPTAYASFSSTVMRSMVPAQGELTVVVALLVSTSITSWSSRTGSPGLTRSLITVASAIDSPNCGMMIGTCGMLKRVVRDYILTSLRAAVAITCADGRSEEHTSELQSQSNLVCRLLLEKKKKIAMNDYPARYHQHWSTHI